MRISPIADVQFTDELFQLLGLPDNISEVFAPELSSLDRSATDRHQIITKILGQPQAIGKQVLLEAWMGKEDTSGINWSPEATALLTTLANVGRLTRWIAM